MIPTPRQRAREDDQGDPPGPSRATRRHRPWIAVRPGERLAFALSFAYFGLLLAAYYTLRPVRDALAAGVIGAGDLRYAFLAVFAVMLLLVPVFGTLAARLPRRRLIPVIYVFFIANVLVFHWLFQSHAGARWLAYLFFVWLSIFNLFVVSVFWSFMADVFDPAQAERLFGPIAAGGSLGAMTGPLLTALFVEALGIAQLLFVSAGLLTAALACMLALAGGATDRAAPAARPMGGGALEGVTLLRRHAFLRGVTAFMVLGTLTGALLYLQQVELVGRIAGGSARLTAVFARVDLAVNVLCVVFQLFLTTPLLRALGFPRTLALLPLVAAGGFVALALAPTLALVIAMQVARRSLLFAVTNPVSQMLFTAVGPKSRYKFKNFLDTAVYRAGDTGGAWLFAGLTALGAGLAPVALFGAVAAGGWVAVAAWVGRRFEAIEADGAAPP